MKKLCYFISFLFLLLTFAGCENDGTLNENSEIVVVGLGHKVYNLPLGNEILFTGNDIKWFNRDTREIRFYDHSVFKEKLEQYEKILVILADTELFTATNVSDVMASVSTVYNDLVLYYDIAEDKYYLNDSYPANINVEQVRLNTEIREENWGLFLYQLGIEGRLK